MGGSTVWVRKDFLDHRRKLMTVLGPDEVGQGEETTAESGESAPMGDNGDVLCDDWTEQRGSVVVHHNHIGWDHVLRVQRLAPLLLHHCGERPLEQLVQLISVGEWMGFQCDFYRR